MTRARWLRAHALLIPEGHPRPVPEERARLDWTGWQLAREAGYEATEPHAATVRRMARRWGVSRATVSRWMASWDARVAARRQAAGMAPVSAREPTAP